MLVGGILVGFVCALASLGVSVAAIGPSGAGSFVFFGTMVAAIYVLYAVTKLWTLLFSIAPANAKVVLSLVTLLGIAYTVWLLFTPIAAAVATFFSPVVLAPLVMVYGVKLAGTAIAYAFASAASAAGEPFWRGFLCGFNSGYVAVIGVAVHTFILASALVGVGALGAYLAYCVSCGAMFFAAFWHIGYLATGARDPMHTWLQALIPLRASSWSSMAIGSLAGLLSIATHFAVPIVTVLQFFATVFTGGGVANVNPYINRRRQSEAELTIGDFIFLSFTTMAGPPARLLDHAGGHMLNMAMFGGAFELVSRVDEAVAALLGGGPGRVMAYGERLAESAVQPDSREGRPVVPLWGEA